MNGFEVWLFLTLLPNLSFPIGLGYFLCMVCLVAFTGGALFNYSEQLSASRKQELENIKEKTADKYSIARLEEHNKHVRLHLLCTSWAKKSIVFLSIFSLLATAIPDRKEIAAIILIPYVSNNAEFKNIPTNLAKKLNEYLTDKLDKEVVEGTK